MRAALVCLLFASAAPMPAAAVPAQVVITPAVGIEQTVTAGSAMFTRETGVPTVELLADYKIGGLFGGEALQTGQRLRIDEIYASGKDTVACTVGSGSLEGTCLIDKDGNGEFDRHRPRGAAMSSKLKSPLPYRPAAPLASPDAAGSFRQTLVFLGITDKVLRIVYREFAEDIARPAFSDDLTFTMSGSYPETIAYKDLVIDVLGVSNAGIRYVIRKAPR